MSRYHRLLISTALVLGLLVAAVPTSAASPAAPGRLNAPNAVAPFDFERGSDVDLAQARANLRADLAALRQASTPAGFRPARGTPSAISAAVALQKSLTASQRARLTRAVDGFAGQFRAVTGATKPTAATNGRSPSSVEAKTAAVAGLATKLDRQVAKILSPRQLKLSQAALSPAALKASPLALGTKSLTSSCYYGAYYTALALWYEYYAYYYSYYNYVVNGDTYAYYGYYYSYYSYAYGPTAARYLGAAYFHYLAQGSDWWGDGSTGTSYQYYAYYNAYYAYIYNYYSYATYGNGYGYYAYYYSYYAQYYAYYGYYYGYNYCY